jgi:uncharacterized protein YciI
MALYTATLTYTDDKDKIQQVRPTHREYLKSLVDSGRLHESGPFTDDSGALIIYVADSEADARELLANDPFTINGVITEATVREWKIVMSTVGTAV